MRQRPQHGAAVVGDLDVRPEGPYHPTSPQSEEPLPSWQRQLMSMLLSKGFQSRLVNA